MRSVEGHQGRSFFFFNLLELWGFIIATLRPYCEPRSAVPDQDRRIPGYDVMASSSDPQPPLSAESSGNWRNPHEPPALNKHCDPDHRFPPDQN